jgi:hypothetical protein
MENRNQAFHRESIPGPFSQDLPIAPNPAPYLQIIAPAPDVKTPSLPQSIASQQQPKSLIPVGQNSISPAVPLSQRYPVLRPGVLVHDALVSVTVNINQQGQVTPSALAASDTRVPAELL